MRNFKISFWFISLSLFLCFSNIARASDTQVKNHKNNNRAYQNIVSTEDLDRLEERYNQIIKEYKSYLSSVDSNTQKEIMEFHEKMASLNHQKKAAYNDLSKEAKAFLAETNKFKQYSSKTLGLTHYQK